MKIAMFAQCMYPPWIEGIKNNSLLLAQELNNHIDLEIISHVSQNNYERDDSIKDLHVHYLLGLSDNPFLQIYYFIIGAFRSLFFVYTHSIRIVSFQYLETSYILPMIFIIFFKWNATFLLTIYSTDELHIPYKKLFLWIFRCKFRKIIIISEYLRPMVRELGFLDSDIIYIPISYNKEKYNYITPWEERKNKTILFSAGPIEEAGSFFMVNIARLLPQYHFIFAMRYFNRKSEKEMELLQLYINESGVANIEIQRNIDRMQDLLGKVSCFVLPLQDIHIKMLIPVALLEAMARGTLCFVSDLPNLTALVRNEENAIIFNRTNPLELRDKIIKFIENRDIAYNAHVFGSQFPDYQSIGSQYITLIKSL